MSKLYEVEFTITAVVLADNEEHAHRVARGESSEIFRDDPRDGIDVVREIKHADQLPDSWDVECRPYGGKLGEEGVIGDYLEDRPPSPDTKTIDMFASNPATSSDDKGASHD